MKVAYPLEFTLGTCSFICQGTSTRRQQNELFGLKRQAASGYFQSCYSKVEAISWSALPKDTPSKLAGLSSHFPYNIERQAEKLW